MILCNQPLFALYFSVWEILRGFYCPFHSYSLYPFHLSIPFTSLSLYICIYIYISYLSLPLYISPSTFLSISLLLSLFSLSFSLAYLMDVFVLVTFNKYSIALFLHTILAKLILVANDLFIILTHL